MKRGNTFNNHKAVTCQASLYRLSEGRGSRNQVKVMEGDVGCETLWESPLSMGFPSVSRGLPQRHQLSGACKSARAAEDRK